jgi:hypothetical protein
VLFSVKKSTLEELLIADGDSGNPCLAQVGALEIDFWAVYPELSPFGAGEDFVALLVQSLQAIEVTNWATQSIRSLALVGW